MSRRFMYAAAFGTVMAAALVAVACSSTTAPGTGTLQVRLTDAPFSSDSVSRVDVFVVRVDAKQQSADDAEVAAGADDSKATANGWTTVAGPNQKIELLALRNGISTGLGATALPAGSYQSFRLVIDPSQSSVTLKNGMVLTSTSSPSVSFPSAARTGIKINLDQPIVVAADGTTTALVDFDVDRSFVIRGTSIASGGLNFTPVVRGTVK
jgi:hypothetical protein